MLERETSVTGKKRKPRQDAFGAKQKARFIEAYRSSANVRASCEYADVLRATYYRHLHSDPDFAEQVRLAEEEAVDRLAAKAWNNALAKDSDTSLWNLLKAHRPQLYRDPVQRSLQVNLTADELANLSDEDLDKLIDAASR